MLGPVSECVGHMPEISTGHHYKAPRKATMTDDLLPLPEPFTSLPLKGSQTTSVHVWVSDAMHAYALAHILAERERLQSVGRAVIDAPQRQPLDSGPMMGAMALGGGLAKGFGAPTLAAS